MPRTAEPISPIDLKRALVNGIRKVRTNPGIGNYVPHDTQIRFHSSEAKGKLFMGGNRAGKTVGGACEAVMRLLGKHVFRDDLPKAPVRGRGVAVDVDRGIKLIMIPELKKWLPSSELINNNWEDSYSKTDKILTLKNGSTIEFMSYEQDTDKFQGTSRHFVWFDEEPPEEIYKECMARLIDTDGDWWITMTPLIEMSWTYNQLYEPAKVGKLRSVELFEANTADNPHINMDAFERLSQTMSEEEKNTRSSGVYISHTGLVYGEVFTRSRNVIPDIVKSNRFHRIRKEWTHFQMMDHGFNNPTAFLFACYDADGRILIYDQIYKNKLIVGEIAELVLAKRRMLDIETEYTIGDPAIKSTDPLSGSSVQSEYAEHGVFIGLGNNDVDSGIVRVQKMFKEQQLIVTDRCEDVLSEVFKYKWDRHITKAKDRKNKKETPLKKDDHAMDALRYGIMSRPKAWEPVKQKMLPVGATRVSSDYDESLRRKDIQQLDQFLGSEW